MASSTAYDPWCFPSAPDTRGDPNRYDPHNRFHGNLDEFRTVVLGKAVMGICHIVTTPESLTAARTLHARPPLHVGHCSTAVG
jgi:hypothetical protein